MMVHHDDLTCVLPSYLPTCPYMTLPALQQKKYFNDVEARRRQASNAVGQKFNLSKGGKQDPAIKWMELRKKGVIGEREKYEGQETNSGIVSLFTSSPPFLLLAN